MKRLLLTLLFALFLAACSGVSVPEVEQNADATAVPPESPEQEAETGGDATAVDTSADTATTPEEAGIVRDRDWSLGAEDPLVTIIEYGDFQ